jgi:hypothetical protein
MKATASAAMTAASTGSCADGHGSIRRLGASRVAGMILQAIAETLFGNHPLDCFLQALPFTFDRLYVRLSHVDIPIGRRHANE